MKKQILCVLYSAILILALFLLIGCESPTAPKERTDDTAVIREQDGGRN